MKKKEIQQLIAAISQQEGGEIPEGDEWAYVATVRDKTPNGRVPRHIFTSRYGRRAEVRDGIITIRMDKTVEDIPSLQREAISRLPTPVIPSRDIDFW